MSENTQVISWAEQLAKQAAELAAYEPAAANNNKFVSLRGGVMAIDGEAVAGNEMAVIIAASAFENAYYEGQFDANKPAVPTCYSVSRTGVKMEPHADVVERVQEVSDSCTNCPHNVFGSAKNGKGKLCKNSRRLALISAGNFNRAGEFVFVPEFLQDPVIALMRLPVTSGRNFSEYVRKVASAFKRPPFGVITKIKVVPDAKTVFKVNFEVLGPVPDECMNDVMSCVEQANNAVEYKLSLTVDGDEHASTPSKKRKY